MNATRTTKSTASTSLRLTPVVLQAAGVAALIAWALRDNAEYLPSGEVIRRSMSALSSGGHHGGGTFVAPAAVAGNSLASYAGLAAFALHALMIAVAVAGIAVRRWIRSSTVDGGGVVVRLVFAGSVAAVAALTTAVMATVLLGPAISSTATLAASITVLQFSFVLVLAFSVAFGVPWTDGKDKDAEPKGHPEDRSGRRRRPGVTGRAGGGRAHRDGSRVTAAVHRAAPHSP
jgi:hypothetical protein